MTTLGGRSGGRKNRRGKHNGNGWHNGRGNGGLPRPQPTKIIWVADHCLTAEQLEILEDLHPGLKIESRPGHMIGRRVDGLMRFIKENPNALVYAVCSKAQMVRATVDCVRNPFFSFGMFSFFRHSKDVHLVLHLVDGDLKTVWPPKVKAGIRSGR